MSIQPDKTATTSCPAAHPPFYGWKIVGVLWMIDFLNMGFPLYGGTVMNVYMIKQIAMTRSTYGWGFTLFNLSAAISSLAVAASILHCGVRHTFRIGSTLICAASLWMALFARQPWHYLFGFGVLMGAGIGFGTIMPMATTITRWFTRYRGRAMAIALTAPGVAGLAVVPLMNRLLATESISWRMGWMIVATVALLSACLATAFIKERPEDLQQFADGASAPANLLPQPTMLVTTHVWSPAEACRTRSFWTIVIASLACHFPFFFFTAHWILHLRGLGVSAANAALAIGLYTMGSIPGGLVGGWLMDKLPARFAFMLGLGCYIAGSLLALQSDASNLGAIGTASILYGAGFRWSFTCMNTILGHFYGPDAYPKLSGTLLMISAMTCSPAGAIGGCLFDLYKSYRPAFELNIAICLLAILALAFAKLPQKALHP